MSQLESWNSAVSVPKSVVCDPLVLHKMVSCNTEIKPFIMAMGLFYCTLRKIKLVQNICDFMDTTAWGKVKLI